MTHEEFFKTQCREALYVAKGMLEGTVDICDGCQFLFCVWNLAELSADDYSRFINDVDQHFEESPNKKELADYSQGDISKTTHDKRPTVEYHKHVILQVCHYILEKYGKGSPSILNNQDTQRKNDIEALDIHEGDSSIVTKYLRTISKNERKQNDPGRLTVRTLERNPASITMVGMST